MDTSKRAQLACRVLSPTVVHKKAASFLVLGTAIWSGALMPICFNSPMNTLRRAVGPVRPLFELLSSECASGDSRPHFGTAPALFRSFITAKMSALNSSFCSMVRQCNSAVDALQDAGCLTQGT